MLESLEVCGFELSEDDVDGGWAESYRSSLRRLTALSYVFEPVAWRFVRLPHLTDLTLRVGTGPCQNLLFLSSVLDDSQCQLEKLRIDDARSQKGIHRIYSYDAQSQETIHDLIASQPSLTHLAISTRYIDAFVKFLMGDVIRNLRSLEFNASYDSQTLASIYDLIESRCTVLSSPDGNPEISGLQCLTLNSDSEWHNAYFSPSVHDSLSLLKKAGFKLTGNLLEC